MSLGTVRVGPQLQGTDKPETCFRGVSAVDARPLDPLGSHSGFFRGITKLYLLMTLETELQTPSGGDSNHTFLPISQ